MPDRKPLAAMKFRLLLLDANIVIEISRLGLWDRLTEQGEIYLAQTVVEEALFYLDDDGNRQDIDLNPLIDRQRVTVFALTTSDLIAIRSQFDAEYFEKLDPGETESLAYLLGHSPDARICSADKIVFRVLGNLQRSEQGISLEELLRQTGLGRPLSREFTKAYRLEWAKKGFGDGIWGRGKIP